MGLTFLGYGTQLEIWLPRAVTTFITSVLHRFIFGVLTAWDTAALQHCLIGLFCGITMVAHFRSMSWNTCSCTLKDVESCCVYIQKCVYVCMYIYIYTHAHYVAAVRFHLQVFRVQK